MVCRKNYRSFGSLASQCTGRRVYSMYNHFSTSTKINMPSVQFNWIWTLCMQLTSAERYAPGCFSFHPAVASTSQTGLSTGKNGTLDGRASLSKDGYALVADCTRVSASWIITYCNPFGWTVCLTLIRWLKSWAAVSSWNHPQRVCPSEKMVPWS